MQLQYADQHKLVQILPSQAFCRLCITGNHQPGPVMKKVHNTFIFQYMTNATKFLDLKKIVTKIQQPNRTKLKAKQQIITAFHATCSVFTRATFYHFFQLRWRIKYRKKGKLFTELIAYIIASLCACANNNQMQQIESQ